MPAFLSNRRDNPIAKTNCLHPDCFLNKLNYSDKMSLPSLICVKHYLLYFQFDACNPLVVSPADIISVTSNPTPAFHSPDSSGMPAYAWRGERDKSGYPSIESR